MRRELRAAAAGVAAATCWVAVEPVWRRAFGAPHSELRLVGRLLASERAWRPVGLTAHLVNGALFGLAFDRLGGRGAARAVLVAEVENALLWPLMLVVDHRHPDVRSGAWPGLARNPRAAAQEIASHAVFGLVLGSLLPEPR